MGILSLDGSDRCSIAGLSLVKKKKRLVSYEDPAHEDKVVMNKNLSTYKTEVDTLQLKLMYYKACIHSFNEI